MSLKYVGKCKGRYKTTLKDQTGEPLTALIWGDPVRIEQEGSENAIMHARGHSGYVDTNDLVDEGLLEIYVIDVGQGDGILFRTPDNKWHLMDGGAPAHLQMTKKGTANFLRWKFQEDLGIQTVSLENIYLSHPDEDHYGGLIDVLKGNLYDRKSFPVAVENF